VNLGGSVTLSAVATGVPSPTFQWQKNGGDISGATSNTLTLNPVNASDAGSYTLVATNSLGSATSSAADLTVNLPPTITVEPVAKIVAQGTSTSFEVTATGSGTLSYKWRKNGTEISGANAAVLGLSNVQTADAGSYDVVVSNFVSSATSTAVALSVQVPVSITTQPASQTAITGDTVSLSVGASGDPSPTYQWRKNSVSLSGETSTTLNLGTVSLSDAADYDVVVTNALGSVTSDAATVTVHVPVSISVAPQSQTLTTGSTLTLTVEADGFPAPTYQWRKNGDAISGATSATYSKADVTPDDSGSYDVVVSNVVGDQTSAAASITVQTLPVISVQPTGGVFLAGGAGQLVVEASGGSALSYQWRKGGAAVSGATSATLAFTDLTLADAGSFDVVVTNSAGSVTSDAVEVAVVELTGSHSYAGTGYRAGKVLTINNTLTYAGNLTSFGWSVMPPAAIADQKWTFGASGGSAGQVAPQAEDTDLFEWAWTSTPASPIEFSYTLNVPVNVTGDQMLTAVLRARFSGTEVSTMVKPDPLAVPLAPSTHHADFDQDNKINLSELLRVIELYNTREGTRRTGDYRAEDGTVDGFAPGPEQ
jgi:hypothetical protein